VAAYWLLAICELHQPWWPAAAGLRRAQLLLQVMNVMIIDLVGLVWHFLAMCVMGCRRSRAFT